MAKSTFGTSTRVIVDLISNVSKQKNLVHGAGKQWALHQTLQGADFNIDADGYRDVFTAIGKAYSADEKEAAAYAKKIRSRINASRAACHRAIDNFATIDEVTAFVSVATTSKLDAWLEKHNLQSRSMMENASGAYTRAKGLPAKLENAKIDENAETVQEIVDLAIDTLKVLNKHSTLAVVAEQIERLEPVAGFDVPAWYAPIKAAQEKKDAELKAALEAAAQRKPEGDTKPTNNPHNSESPKSTQGKVVTKPEPEPETETANKAAVLQALKAGFEVLLKNAAEAELSSEFAAYVTEALAPVEVELKKAS